MNKREIKQKKKELTEQLEQIQKELTVLNRLEKPFVANVVGYSGHFDAPFDTEEKARKKYEEYKSKKKFRNGISYGVFLYRWKEDGTILMLEEEGVSKMGFKALDYKHHYEELFI